MNLSKLRNPKLLVVLVMSFSIAVLTSCKKEEEDITVDVTYTYEGAFDNGNGFQSTDYEVSVTKVNYNTVKITPEDGNGTSFEVTIIPNTFIGGYVDSTGEIVFAKTDNVMGLVYRKGVEEFSGVKI